MLQVPRCEWCGKTPAADGIHAHIPGQHRWLYYRCECGREWTEQLPDGVDRAEMVSADEVLSVHEALIDFEGPLTELLEVPHESQ